MRTLAISMFLLGLLVGLCGCVTLDKVVSVLPADTTPASAVSNVVDAVTKPDTAQSVTDSNQLPFDAARCKFYRIDAGVLSWPQTRTLTVQRFTADKLWSSCSGPDWTPAIDGLQGNFALAVEQTDGSIVVGTWDWNRAKHQPMKGLENLRGEEHSFFNLRSGARVWWFCTSFSRGGGRHNCKERTNFVPGVWP